MNLFPGMIGSLEEYAQIVGKSVSQLADAKYEPPEVHSLILSYILWISDF